MGCGSSVRATVVPETFGQASLADAATLMPVPSFAEMPKDESARMKTVGAKGSVPSFTEVSPTPGTARVSVEGCQTPGLGRRSSNISFIDGVTAIKDGGSRMVEESTRMASSAWRSFNASARFSFRDDVPLIRRLSRRQMDEEQASAVRLQAHIRARQARKKLQMQVKHTDSARVLKRKDTAALRRVNDYKIGKLLGAGAYGRVYRATKYFDVYAIKVVKKPSARRGREGGLMKNPSLSGKAQRHSAEQSAAELRREITIMKKLNHPNVVRLFEVIDDEEHDELFMVMELIDGNNLLEPITQKRVVPDAELRVWMRDMLMGIEHLHLNGVCHRDIKPENVLWDKREQRAKLADFGTARLINERPKLGGDYVTATEGTVCFFAPEMCQSGIHSKGGYSARAADWWAYGVCLYMWVYHEAPFVAPTPMLLMEKIRTEPVSYDKDAHGASDSVIVLLQGLLAQNPRVRYSLGDIRRDAFITADGKQPLPEPDVPTDGQSLAKSELEGAITRIIAEQSFFRASANHGDRDSCRSSGIFTSQRDSSDRLPAPEELGSP